MVNSWFNVDMECQRMNFPYKFLFAHNLQADNCMRLIEYFMILKVEESIK